MPARWPAAVPWNAWLGPWRRFKGSGQRLRRLPLAGLGLCLGAWWLTQLPYRQALEGTLEATALSFRIPAALPGSGEPFLGLALRSLSVSGLNDGESGAITIGGRRVELSPGTPMILEARAVAPGGGQVMYLELRLPPGVGVRHLQAERGGELRLDLLPPPGGTAWPEDALVLTPVQPLRVRTGDGLEPAPTVPVGRFSARLEGALQLRILPLATTRTVEFEPNLRISQLQLEAERDSLFDRLPIQRSSLRSGTVHLGLRPPLQLRRDQYLSIEPPGVTEVTDLRFQPTRGSFSLAVVGESSGLSSGLSQRVPTTVIKGSLLSRHLSPEQIAGFYGVLTGVASSALLVLFKAD